MINFQRFKPDELRTYHWPADHVLQLLSHHSDFGGSTAKQWAYILKKLILIISRAIILHPIIGT